MKKGVSLFLILVLVSSVVSAASLFEDSAWDEWLTGNPILKLFRRSANQPQIAVKQETSSAEQIVIPSVYIEPATGPVSPEQFNNLLAEYESLVQSLSKQKNVDFVTNMFFIDLPDLKNFNSFSKLQLPNTVAGLLLVQFKSGDLGAVMVDVNGNPLQNLATIIGRDYKARSKGEDARKILVTAALSSFKTMNAGHVLTEECGVGQEGSGFAEWRLDGFKDGFKPGTDTKTGAGAQPAPSQEEIRNQFRFGPGGSRVNPGTGYVTQVNDPGNAGARRQGCNDAAAKYREERTRQMQEDAEKYKDANKNREAIQDPSVSVSQEGEEQYNRERIKEVSMDDVIKAEKQEKERKQAESAQAIKENKDAINAIVGGWVADQRKK